LDKEDFNISVTDGVLTVAAQHFSNRWCAYSSSRQSDH
jgi:hypothetical protein